MRKLFRFLPPLLFLLILLVHLLTPKTQFEKNKEARNYQALAQELIASNQLGEAKHELLPNSPELLIIKNLEAQPEEIKTQIIFWQKIADEFPNYRDANIKLAILNWKISRLFDAQKFLNKALEIDPNFEVIKQLSLQ